MLDSMIHRGSYMSAHVLLIFFKRVEEKKEIALHFISFSQ